MKKILTFLTGFVAAALLGLGVAALAQTDTTYYGWNPITGLQRLQGALTSGGAQPVLSGCATISAQVGGATAGKFATSGTSCNLTITFPSAAPNGWHCIINDLTTPANSVKEASTTTTTAVFSGTTTAADVLSFYCIGY